MAELEELASFLVSPRPEVQRAAVEIVAGLTGSDEGLEKLRSYTSLITSALLPLLPANKEVSHLAAQTLVNLAQDPDAAKDMVTAGAVQAALRSACELVGRKEEASEQTGLLVMLLANLTQLEEASEKLLEHPSLTSTLIRHFATSTASDDGQDDPLEHMASVLVNLSRVEGGRKLLLDKSKQLLRLMLRQASSTNGTRRRGVVSAVRNCCFDASSDLSTILLAADLLWPTLLLPLAGTQAYSKEETAKMPSELAAPLGSAREACSDEQLKADCADAVFLIVSHEAGRRAFWGVNGPKILQVGYEYEEQPDVLQAMERVGSLLVSDMEKDADAQ